MNRPWFWVVIVLCPFCPGGDRLLSGGDPTPCPAAEARPERHRSPVDLVVLPDGRRALTANSTADSASLIDLAAGKVLAEQACGARPAGVACSRDGKRAAVSNLWAGTLTLLDVKESGLQLTATVPVGDQPRGVVFAPDGASLYVALAGADEVVQLGWDNHKILRRWPAPGEPRRLALTRDGRSLLAISGLSAQVRCWDTQTGQVRWERKIHGAFNLHGLALSPDDQELVTAHSHDRQHAIAKHNIEQGWAIDNRLSRLTLVPDARIAYWQLALDTRGQAVGDPCAVAFSARGDWLVAAAAGTQELLLFQRPAVPWSGGDPGDFLDARLDLGDGKYRRLPLGGRPLAVQFVGESEWAVVANYLLDAVQVVDVKAGKLLRQVALGGPARPDLARQGEVIFYDAKRSHHQWFSCHTCHPDGHTCGLNFDTLNDDSYGNPKLTPTLRGVSHTGPFTWHGWQKELSQAVEKSLTETNFGPEPSAQEIKAVVAFLETLAHPPNPHRRPDGSRSEAAIRGQAIFNGKGHCNRCHQGEYYTAAKNFDVKLEADGSPFELWNPPSLRGLLHRRPYLHDGRAETLDDVIRSHHSPEKLGGEKLTEQERQDLIAFLKSL